MSGLVTTVAFRLTSALVLYIFRERIIVYILKDELKRPLPRPLHWLYGSIYAFIAYLVSMGILDVIGFYKGS